MRYYEHAIYKKRKKVRDRISKYLPISNYESTNKTEIDFIDSVLIDFIELSENSNWFKENTKEVLNKCRIKKGENIIYPAFYFVTTTEKNTVLNKYDFDLVMKDPAIKVTKYELTGTIDHYYWVKVKGLKNDKS